VVEGERFLGFKCRRRRRKKKRGKRARALFF
jgi:hypothetical protein